MRAPFCSQRATLIGVASLAISCATTVISPERDHTTESAARGVPHKEPRLVDEKKYTCGPVTTILTFAAKTGDEFRVPFSSLALLVSSFVNGRYENMISLKAAREDVYITVMGSLVSLVVSMNVIPRNGLVATAKRDGKVVVMIDESERHCTENERAAQSAGYQCRDVGPVECQSGRPSEAANARGAPPPWE